MVLLCQTLPTQPRSMNCFVSLQTFPWTIVRSRLSHHPYLCLSHASDENRSHLLEAGFPQATSSLLESYVELVPQSTATKPFPFTAPHLNVIRSAIGLLLNSSVGYGAYLESSICIQSHNVDIDPVKDRLNSLETALTVLKLLNAVYPPTSWTDAPSDDDETRNIWTLRATISSWGWRTITELKDVKDESEISP